MRYLIALLFFFYTPILAQYPNGSLFKRFTTDLNTCPNNEGQIEVDLDLFGSINSGGRNHYKPYNDSSYHETVYEWMPFLCVIPEIGNAEGLWLKNSNILSNINDNGNNTSNEFSVLNNKLKINLTFKTLCTEIQYCFTFTNTSTQRIQNISITPYLDGDLYFGSGGLGNDYGATNTSIKKQLWEFDEGDNPNNPSSFVGTYGLGDINPNSWEISNYSNLRNRIMSISNNSCTVLRNSINVDGSNADLDNDLITDYGYDITLALQYNSNSLDIGETSHEICYAIKWGVSLPCSDEDLDNICLPVDNCPSIKNTDQIDSDADGLGDACDNCPNLYNPDQFDSNNNGVGDACCVNDCILPNTPPNITYIVYDSFIDLNGSYDSEGSFFTNIEILDGNGSLTKINELLYLYSPNGDGLRTDTLNITATDNEGLSSFSLVNIEIPNIPPVVQALTFEHKNLNPIIQSVESINKGNGYYEVITHATPNTNIEIKALASIFDFDNTLSATFNNDLVIYPTPFETPFILSPNAGSFNVIAFDGEDYSAPYTQDFSFPKAKSLSYTVNINDESFIEVVDGSLNTYSFKAFSDETPITIIVKDNLGLSSQYTTTLNTINYPPTLENLNITQNGRQVSFRILALDVDTLQYELDTGDGNLLTNNLGVFSHYYINDGVYNPIIKITDSRGATITHTLESLSFISNLPPIIQSITSLNGYAGKCWVIVEATDPNNDTLSYEVQVAGLNFDNLDFVLPYQASPYLALLTIKDTEGLSTTQEFQIQVIDTPTSISINQYRLTGDNFIFVANAQDPDTNNLKFFWKIDDQDYIENSNISILPLNTNIQHTIYVKVLDTWSNLETITSITVNADPLPVINDVPAIINGGGEVSLSVISNTSFLDYLVDWGDGTINNSLQHKYAWSESPYQIKVHGLTSNRQSEVYTKDIQVINHPTTIEDIQVWQDDGIITVSVYALDIDVDDVLYSFDFENDGILESDNLWNPTKIYEAQRAGSLPIKILAFDQWSNTYTEVIKEIDVQAWLLNVDNIQSEEGRCVILSANDLDNAKINLENCNLESDITSDYLWLLENEVNKMGEEVAYLFEDDGIYTIKMISPEGYYNKIRIHVSNVAPIFTSIPDMVAYAGSVYKYDIQVKDQGSLDMVEVKLGAGSPTNMTLTQVDDFLYRLEWQVPNEIIEASVTLIALDYQGSDEHYTYDGGRTEQSFRIHVIKDNNNMGIKDMGIKDMGIKDMLLDQDMSMLIDQALMYEDITPTKNTKFQGASCQSVNSSINLFLILFFIVLFKRLYKHIS